MAGPNASVGALLEALLAMGAVEESEYELLLHALAARDRLIHGYSPQRCDTTDPDRIWSVLQITVRLLGAADPPGRRAVDRT